MTTKQIKRKRQYLAKQRVKQWRSLSDLEKINRLNERLGKDKGAQKQRKQLNKALIDSFIALASNLAR